MSWTVSIQGKAYPCYRTMGAMLEYKRQTGEEASSLSPENLSGMVVFLWCLTKSASEADGVEFGYGLQEFANRLSPDEFSRWCKLVAEESAETDKGEKKSRRK